MFIYLKIVILYIVSLGNFLYIENSNYIITYWKTTNSLLRNDYNYYRVVFVHFCFIHLNTYLQHFSDYNNLEFYHKCNFPLYLKIKFYSSKWYKKYIKKKTVWMILIFWKLQWNGSEGIKLQHVSCRFEFMNVYTGFNWRDFFFSQNSRVYTPG